MREPVSLWTTHSHLGVRGPQWDLESEGGPNTIFSRGLVLNKSLIVYQTIPFWCLKEFFFNDYSVAIFLIQWHGQEFLKCKVYLSNFLIDILSLLISRYLFPIISYYLQGTIVYRLPLLGEIRTQDRIYPYRKGRQESSQSQAYYLIYKWSVVRKSWKKE